jgi:serine/threonine protein kinase
VHIGTARLHEFYEMDRLIGSGAFGKVYHATHKPSGTAVAIKVITIPEFVRVEEKRAYKDNVQRELDIMCRLSHPCILSVIEAFRPNDDGAPSSDPAPAGSSAQRNAPHGERNTKPPRCWHIVLELCTGTDLQAIVEQYGALELDDVRTICAQLCAAVHHCHMNGGRATLEWPPCPRLPTLPLIPPPPPAARTWGRDRCQLTAANSPPPVPRCHFPPSVVHRDIKPANIMVLDSDDLSTTTTTARTTNLVQIEGGTSTPPGKGGARRGARGGKGPSLVQIKVLDFGLSHNLGDDFISFYRTEIARRVSAKRTPVAAGARKARERQLSAVITSGAARKGDKGQDDASESVRQGSAHGPEPSTDDASINPSRYSFAVEPAGSRAYAPPEIKDYHRFTAQAAARGGMVVATTLLVDAYAIGAVMRHLLTGVPPDRSVMDFIEQQTGSPVEWLLRVFRACRGKSVVHYRYLSELPPELVELLNRLMDTNASTRMSVTQLTEHPWVAGAPGAERLPFMLPSAV